MMLMAGWFGCFGFNRPLSQSISSCCLRRLRERERERERSKQRPLAPTTSTLEACPTQIQISRTPGTHVTHFYHPATRLLPDAEEAVALQMDIIFSLFFRQP